MGNSDFNQIEWDDRLADDCRQLIRLAVREDLDRYVDWTTAILVGESAEGRARVAARQAGVVAGQKAALLLLSELDPRIEYRVLVGDGQPCQKGAVLAEMSGPARSLLTAERPLLNMLGHLCGIASLTARYVAAVAGTQARIYDTRKTMPGWRRLEKYAVRCGGGFNHRTGLFDAVLIKDNHLAVGAAAADRAQFTPAEAVRRVRAYQAGQGETSELRQMPLEVEVDTLEQLQAVLVERPDIILLDNMPPVALRQAVTMRDELAQGVVLEASGGVNLETVAAIAAAGVERISVGAITHSAIWLDVGLDWH